MNPESVCLIAALSCGLAACLLNPEPEPQRNWDEQMVMVKGGLFEMGDTFSSYASDAKPTHMVTLSSSYIGKYEVTQRLWSAYADTNPAFHRGGSLPVEQVDWYGVFIFCNRLSQAHGLQPCYHIGGRILHDTYEYMIPANNAPETRHTRVSCSFNANGYRLPTEAEWEYAARGGRRSKGTLYSGSNNPDQVAWCAENSGNAPHAVGTKTPNELGIYDLSGNVIERVWDWYAAYSGAALINPAGPAEGSARIMRGGSFAGSAQSCTVYHRKSHPSWRDYTTGFRLCRNGD